MKTRKLVVILLSVILCFGLVACKKGEHRLLFVEGKAATCTEPGEKAHYHCTICEKDYSAEDSSEEIADVVIPALGHDFADPVSSRTVCTEPGTAEYTCRRCRTVETKELAAGEHLFRSYITEPTCVKEGQSYKVCLICGYSETETLPATGDHLFNTENVCTLCNLRCVPSEGLVYDEIHDNGLLVGYAVSCGAASGNIVVPYYHDSLPVLEIAENGFFEKELTGLVSYAPLRAIGDCAFKNCIRLPSFKLPDTLKSIGKEAFYSCATLTELSIPDSVQTLGGSAFSQCSNLKTLQIGAGLQGVGSDVFWNCASLSSIRVSKGNKALKSENDCLIERATDTLLLGGSGSAIPETVKVIGANAFFGRTELKKIVVPRSVVQICDYAFRDCTYLNELQYEGPQSAWEQIRKGTEWDLNTGEDFKVTFTE